MAQLSRIRWYSGEIPGYLKNRSYNVGWHGTAKKTIGGLSQPLFGPFGFSCKGSELEGKGLLAV